MVGEIKPEDTSYVDELKRRVNEAGLTEQIKFVGLQLNAAGFFRHSDIFAALSGTKAWVNRSRGLSSGCAVIASTAGAWPDIITHGENGFTLADVEATRASPSI